MKIWTFVHFISFSEIKKSFVYFAQLWSIQKCILTHIYEIRCTFVYYILKYPKVHSNTYLWDKVHFCILQSLQKRVRNLKNFLKMKASKSCCKSLQIRLNFNRFGHFQDQRLLRANLRWYIIVFQGKAWFRMAPAKPKAFFESFLWDKRRCRILPNLLQKESIEVYIYSLYLIKMKEVGSGEVSPK